MRMPPTQTDEGLQVARAIRARHPGVGVLVLSQYAEPGLAMELLGESVEGLGYLLKDRVQDIDEFAAALRRVAAGGSAIDPEIVSGLLRRERSPDPLAGITPRDREVLGLMAEGRSNQGIADRLGVTRAGRPEAHHEHLPAARTGRERRRPQARAGGAGVPARAPRGCTGTHPLTPVGRIPARPARWDRPVHAHRRHPHHAGRGRHGRRRVGTRRHAALRRG